MSTSILLLRWSNSSCIKDDATFCDSLFFLADSRPLNSGRTCEFDPIIITCHPSLISTPLSLVNPLWSQLYNFLSPLSLISTLLSLVTPLSLPSCLFFTHRPNYRLLVLTIYIFTLPRHGVDNSWEKISEWSTTGWRTSVYSYVHKSRVRWHMRLNWRERKETKQAKPRRHCRRRKKVTERRNSKQRRRRETEEWGEGEGKGERERTKIKWRTVKVRTHTHIKGIYRCRLLVLHWKLTTSNDIDASISLHWPPETLNIGYSSNPWL